MLGEALKASASEESAGLPSFKLGSQAVGLLALMAVSGAVAILSLSKQKLWNYLIESTHATSDRLTTLASDFFSSNVTSCPIPTASSAVDQSKAGVEALDFWDSRANEVTCKETNFGTFADNLNDTIARTGNSSAATEDGPFCDKVASDTSATADEGETVLTSQPSTPSSLAEPGIKTRHVLKKVKFAPDVVEPSGDGREYRGRIRTARIINNSMSSSGKLKGLDTGDDLWDRPMTSSANAKAAIKGYGFQILAKPKLPANRMALYSGMLGYRSQMILDC